MVDVVTARDASAVAALCARRDLDLVSVHSPPGLHRAHVEAAVASGHAVLCDKPLGTSTADAHAIWGLVHAAGVDGFLNLEFRADPSREEVVRLVADGAIGTVQHVGYTQVSDRTRNPLRPYGWLFDAAQHGGVIQALAPHAVDHLQTMIGPITLTAGIRRQAILERPDYEGELQRCTAEDGFSAVFASERGATASLDVSFAAAVSLAPCIVVNGSEGSLIDAGDGRVTLARGDEHSVVYDGSAAADPHLAMRRYAALVRDARGGDEHARTRVASIDDGVAIERVLDDLRRAPLMSIE